MAIAHDSMMNPKIEELMSKVDSKFKLVTLGAMRARQINSYYGQLGEGLGRILKTVLERTRLRRALVAGGDSSSHALGQLDIYALTTRKPLPATPGSPLCTARSTSPSLDGIEIALKGGQLGGEDYFSALTTGKV